MSKQMRNKILSAILVFAMIASVRLGLGMGVVRAEEESAPAMPKYIFFFIGDGMSHVQASAARVYKGNNTEGEVLAGELNFTSFPVNGIASTFDSTSFCPDSASTATAFSCGVKTHSGVIGLEVDKVTAPRNLSEILSQDLGYEIGIASTVTINHATPAAFYAHVASRNEYYDIAMQMADSGYNYFGGGTINKPTGADKDQQDAYEILVEKGYTVTNDPAEIMALDADADMVYAYTDCPQDGGALPYSLDAQEGQLTLSDYVTAGINVMGNPENGFFFMVESGKIDWACHANDAKATIYDTLELDNAIQVALDFAAEHPDETLIVVTGDHETGGMTIGQSYTGYDTAFDLLAYQKMSFVAFDALVAGMLEEDPELTFEEVMPVITENFGLVTPVDASTAPDERLVLSKYEYKKLLDAFETSLMTPEEQTNNEENYILYGGYNPLSVTLTHILNNKSGIGWTSYSHTGTPVAVHAYGAGSEYFGGSYDNTDIYTAFLEAVGLAVNE
ncbi:MAG: alkaline phosphatase [Bacillota bacterium]|nr:alkaline phosphatase [Bacillota bacterium]